MRWYITLLGKAQAVRENRAVSHFESSRTVALLARLALFPRRVHPREELVELLWPGVTPEVARGRLRRAVFTLRQQLEAGLPVGSVLIADRLSLRLNPDAFTTDTAQFEQALGAKDHERAYSLYTDVLLPGLWDDWIVEERNRLEALADTLPPPLAPNDQGEITTPLSAATPVSRPWLPAYLTAFVGREREAWELQQLLHSHRLVTLTGMGGTGKTRLAVEVARQLPVDAGPVHFVALADCADADQIPARIGAALGLSAEANDPLAQVCFYLEAKPCVLLLDNLEQLVPSGAAEQIEKLLTRLPDLTCLTTTRRALSLPGERLFLLEPLPPKSSLALFVDRVQAVRPGFHPTDGNRADLQAVCRRLDGIPLALELAASRLRAFTVAEMKQELEKGLDWLVRAGKGRNKDDRHRSLEATLEWSWRLLSDAEQQTLATMALLPAAWRLEQAQEICGVTADAACLIESLVLDSLLVTEQTESGETIFALRETVREFVGPRLQDTLATRRRLREHLLSCPTRDENIVAAWEYALTDRHGEHAYAFAECYYAEWSAIAGPIRSRSLLERTLELPAASPRLRLRAHHQLAINLQHNNQRGEAIARMDAARQEVERSAPPPDLFAESLVLYAHITQFDVPAAQTLAHLDHALEIAETPVVRAEAMRIKGSVLTWHHNDTEAAGPLFAAAEPLYPAGHRGRRALLSHRAQLALRRNHLEEALNLYQEGAIEAAAAGDTVLADFCRHNVADVLARQGKWQAAAKAGCECLRAAERLGDRHALLVILWNLALPLLKAGNARLAAQIMGFSASCWVREVRPLNDEEEREIDDLRRQLALVLPDAQITRAWEQGTSLTLKEAITSVLSELK